MLMKGQCVQEGGLALKDVGWVRRLFRSIDAMDIGAFLSFLEDDAPFRIGSERVLQGKEAIRKTIQLFFAGIKRVRHEILETWFHPETVICQGQVTYTRTDETSVTIPFVNVLRTRTDRIREYLIYIDVKPLYSAAT
jgi:hypothetical protein